MSIISMIMQNSVIIWCISPVLDAMTVLCFQWISNHLCSLVGQSDGHSADLAQQATKICTNVMYKSPQYYSSYLNTLRPRWNEQHFADNIFKHVFFNENVCILIKISLKFVPKGPINNIPALVQIMAWRRSGVKPLSEPMMVSLLTHIYVTRPQWVNTLRSTLFQYWFR